MATKQEVMRDALGKYLKAGRMEKGMILSRLEQTVHMHRKAIMCRLGEIGTRLSGNFSF